MKPFIAALLVFHLLIQYTRAVLLQDAFVKDWVTYKYGDLSSCSILSPESLLCLSSSEHLYSINLDTQKVEYYIELSKWEHNAYELADSLIATYSPGGKNVHIWESATGIFIQELSLNSPVKSVEQVLNDLYIVLADGSVTTVVWDGEQLSFQREDTRKSLRDTYTAYLHGVSGGFGGAETAFDTLSKGKRNPKIVVESGSHYFALISTFDIAVLNFTYSDDQDSKAAPKFLLPVNGEVLDLKFFNSTAAVLTRNDSKFAVELINPSTEEVSVKSIAKSQSSTGKSILVNKPVSLSTIDKVHHLVEETHSKTELVRWLLRVKTHLSQLGKFVTSFVVQSPSITAAENEIAEDKFGFQKILVTFDFQTHVLIARDSSDGSILWSTQIPKNGAFIDILDYDSEAVVVLSHQVVSVSLRSGDILQSESFDEAIDAAFKVLGESTEEEQEEGKIAQVVVLKTGELLRVWGTTRAITPSQFYLLEHEGKLQSYKLAETHLVPTWSFAPSGEHIISVNRLSGDLTSAIGITRSDRSVLYKYLNPNLVTVVTQTNFGLKIVLLDGISGAVVHVQEHNNEVIDFSSLTLLQTDNWLVYAYHVTYPTIEQRIVVLDLFADKETAVGGRKSIAEGSYNSSITSFATKSFLFPEKILQLESTTTKFGITTRSIIALTESGSLVEIPKFVLNSRRIDDRKMTQEDAEDDFRLTPYEPIVMFNAQGVLNHKQKLQISQSPQHILVSPTGLESSAVVCFVNEFNEFCTTVQPSLSYDILSGSFDKTKLLITLATLLIALLVSKPFVESKKLNARWID